MSVERDRAQNAPALRNFQKWRAAAIGKFLDYVQTCSSGRERRCRD